MNDVQELVSWLLPSVYIALIGVIYGFYALVKKRSQNEHSKYTPVGEAPLDLADISDNGTVPLLSHADGGSGAGISSNNEDDVEPEEGMETWTVTETGALWATVGLTLLLAVYHGAKAVIEAVDGGDRSDVIMHAVLCASSVIAAACRDADHWQHSPEYVGPAPHAPSPRRRRAWLWLFPYFNLTFVTALLRYVRGNRGGATTFVDYMSQDELWALVAQGACLAFVTHSVLVGARVTRLYHASNAEYKAGIFSWLMFSWFTPIIARGQRKQLGLPDLPPQMTWDRSRYVWWRFVRTAGQQRSAKKNRQQQQQQRSGVPGLALRLFRLVRPLFVAQGLWQLLATLAEFTSPLAMQQIVDFVGTYTGGAVDARTTFFVGLLFVGPVVQGIADGRNFHMGRRIGCRVRSALVGAIFRKMLRSDMSSASYSAGELTNLMSVDAAAVLEFSGYTHFMWTTSLSVLLCVGLLFYVLGVSAFGGVAFMLLSIPLGKWTTSKTQTYQRQLMKDKDARMGVVGEVLQGIRIIKLFAWEKNFLGRISEARGAEMASLRGYMIMMAGVIVQWNSVTTLVGLCTFLVHTRLLGKSLSASQGFTSLALFNLLRFPLLVLPDVFNFYLQAKVSLDRIEAFLYRDEVEGFKALEDADDAPAAANPLDTSPAPPGSVSVVNGTFQWSHPPKKEGGEEGGQGAGSGDAADDAPLLTSIGDASAAVEVEDVTLLPPTLVGINLEAGPGQLVCIYGPTGCGKSSLLMAILGEVRRLEGTVQVGGRIAYASQRAWIQNASLRDNILFGAPYDPVWYNSVLQACALAPDLELLEAGDMTEIGERGVNLSGGQQQRVSLARAVYANADVYLLDDVLSAVDAHVGEHLFKRCVRDLLVTRGKTVVMVSHQIALTARYASKVVLMARDGTIAETGDPQVLVKDQRSRLARLVDKVGGGGDLQRQHSVSSITEDNGGLATKLIDAPPEKADAPAAPAAGKPKVLIAEEERARGAPGLEAYVYYCRACGGLVAFLVPYLVLHVSYNGLQFAQNLMLSRWVDALEGGGGGGGAMWSYVGVSLAVIMAIFARSLFQSLASLRASRVLHAAIASRVVRGPMGWFERTPQGRILNRFSSDMQEIDKDTMETYGTTIACFFSVASILVVIAYTAPWLIIALVPISALSWAVGRLYLNTSRELKRLDSVTKSPIYAHFTESVAGVSTIRAFAAQQRFLRESFRRVDACNRAHFNLWVSNRWFNIRVQLIGASVALLAGAFLVYWGKDHIAATTAGLALLYALNFTDALKYLVREHALLEMQMNSVERVIEFTQIPQEAPPVVEGRRPPPNWPQHGAIQFTDLTLQYPSATTPVIEGMTFNVEPRTRIGIVGRTGAGKSSLTAALFRLVEPKRGSIVIDGVDILTMGLEDLRSRLAIVPQDPVLFRGTIRSNLDPFDEHTDVDLWSALQRAHLARSVTSLDAAVEEGGSNLSMGQRQLMCMARALVRRASILVMDEATAAVDPETDILIQEVMRSELRDCTILCIAHRLHTIIFYDRILVLERGRVAEYAPPLSLLRDPHSLFRALCEKSGALAELLAVAEDEELTRVSGASGNGNGNGNGNGHNGAGAAAADGAH